MSVKIDVRAALGTGASVVLSPATVVESAAPADPVGALSVIGGGDGPWTFSLLNDAGGMFALDGSDIVVGATALDHSLVPKPFITVQAVAGPRVVETQITVTVRVRAFDPPVDGSLVFGAQGNMAYPVRGTPTGFTVAAGREHTMCESYLPAQPIGARVIYANSWGIGNGSLPVEYGLPNSQTIAWSSLMTGVNSNSRRQDVMFSEFGLEIAAGGFTISDPIGLAIADGNALRTVISVPLGQQRMANNGFNIIGEQQRASATLSAFDGARVNATASSAGAGIFNAEGFTAAGIIVPRPAGFRSFLLIGTSIMRGEDTTYRYILSPSRNTYGYLPFGLDSATNGRMGWWQAAVNGQNIAKQSNDAAGRLAKRFAILEAIAVLNGGRWPFTDIVLDFRNDFVGIPSGPDAASTFALFVAKAIELIAAIAELFRGIPIHIVDCPPIQPSGLNPLASRFGTEPAIIAPAAGNHLAAAVKLFNEWVAINFASIGAASVIPAGSACFAPDDGSGVPKWRQTPFMIAGGGMIDAADYPGGLAAGVNVSTTGVTVTSSVAPEVGTYLCLFDPDMGNPEGLPYTAGNTQAFQGWITSVVAAGAGKWLLKTSGGSTARARAPGSIVRTSSTKDYTHSSHWLQMVAQADAVIAWKAAA